MVSVIIPNFNKEKFIQRSLNSLLSQTSEDWEAVIVDDCSTDGSWGIIQEYARRDPRIVALRNETNRGGNYSRNRGLSNSSGEFVIFLDSDDWLAHDCIENRVREISKEENSQIDLLLFKMAGTVHGICRSVSSCGNLETALVRFLRHEMPWQTMMPIMRRKLFDKVGCFDESFPRLQDVEFFSRCLLKGAKCGAGCRESYDCYYCADESRRGCDYEKTAHKHILGMKLFVVKMQVLIDSCCKDLSMRRRCLQALGEMVYRAVRTLGDFRQAGLISSQAEAAIWATYRPSCRGGIYKWCYDHRFNRIHGFNYCFIKFYRLIAWRWLV